MAELDPPDGIKFAEFDITLTDRELDDFLSYMEHQTTGVYAEAAPQLPDVAMDFPGLQLQPHSGSPSHSEGSESAGAGTSGAAGARCSNGVRPAVLPPSDGSLTSAAMSSPARNPTAAGSPAVLLQQLQHQQSPASSPMDISSQQQLEPMQQPQRLSGVKPEPEVLLQLQQQQQQAMPMSNSLPTVLAASAGSAAAASATTLAGTLAADCSLLMASCPTSLDAPQPGFCLQPMQWHSSTAISSAAGQPQQQQQQGQALPQLLFVQPAGLPPFQQQQQSPQAVLPPQPSLSHQLAAFAGLTVPAGAPAAAAAAAAAAGPSCSLQAERQPGASKAGASRTPRQLQQLQQPLPPPPPPQQQQQQLRPSTFSEGSGSKLQISHSTVEKQRRDRLNSLIDELSDMVPPADPKYGSDSNSVRRPKHVVLADTINLLKAMQTKLQLEEAEICTLKQQAAAVGAIAAQHHVGAAAVPEAADAMMHAAAAAAVAGPGTELGAGAAGFADACVAPVELPVAPESGAIATGVLVEQGIGCLYVKVNCKDRKGLLSDVVCALKAFPIVISTAAITTTKEGNVHDVFEVRSEDASVTAEDIQWAVQQALFEAERARSKRLRREDSGVMQTS